MDFDYCFDFPVNFDYYKIVINQLFHHHLLNQLVYITRKDKLKIIKMIE